MKKETNMSQNDQSELKEIEIDSFRKNTMIANQLSVIAEFHYHKKNAWLLPDCTYWHGIVRTGLAEFTPIYVLHERKFVYIPTFLKPEILEGSKGLFAVKISKNRSEAIVLLFTPQELRELMIETMSTNEKYPSRTLPITDEVVRIGTERWGKINHRDGESRDID